MNLAKVGNQFLNRMILPMWEGVSLPPLKRSIVYYAAETTIMETMTQKHQNEFFYSCEFNITNGCSNDVNVMFIFARDDVLIIIQKNHFLMERDA